MHLAPLVSITAPTGTWGYALALATPYLAALNLALFVVLLVLFFLLRWRLGRLTLGNTGSLEETIHALSRNARDTERFRSEMEQYLKHVEARVQGSVQGIGIVRFNPFAGSGGGGGNQSFAIAFLDEKHSGVVLSTLYARDRVGVYGKPIERGISTFELTAEEKEAVEKAKLSLKTHVKRAQ